MPKIITPEKKMEMKNELLRILSVNARASINDIAKKMGIPKPTAYNLLKEVIEEYDLHFVPEINIEYVMRYEFIKMSKTHSKKEMLHRSVEQLTEMGFEEFLIFIKFAGNIPSDEEIMKAIGGSHIPQFIARLHGDYDLIMYVVATNFLDLERFINHTFGPQLKNYVMTIEVNKLFRSLGYFPLRNELIKKFDISDNYKELLLGLNNNGRIQIGELARKMKSNQMRLIYAFERLKRTDILSRVTYFEGKPKNVVSTIVQMKITNINDFKKNRNKWFLSMIKNYQAKHNEYAFVCDISNPIGALLILNFQSSDDVEEFFSEIRKNVKGVEFRYFMMTKSLLGNLGIRNFDMRYSSQYRTLEIDKMVPRFDPTEDNAYVLTESPDEDAVLG